MAAVVIDVEGVDEPLVVTRLTGREAISELYRFEVIASSTGSKHTDPDAWLGARCCISLHDEDGFSLRDIPGLVAEVAVRFDERSLPVFDLVVVPRLWRATMFQTQELFLSSTVPQIVADKLERLGLTGSFELRLLQRYATRDFVVQYGEDDLAFVSRQLEHLGIGFYFIERDGDDVMIVTDFAEGYAALEQPVPYDVDGEGQGAYGVSDRARIIPRSYLVQDYNYRTPEVELVGVHQLQHDRLGTADNVMMGGVVEYGTHHRSPEQGAQLASVRAQERVSERRVIEGSSALACLWPGRTFELADHPTLHDKQLLVTSVEHCFDARDDQSQHRYQLRFVASHSAAGYRPPRRTPRPRVRGIVTGVVQPGPGGAIGGFARLDQQGRYTVQLHFDTAVGDDSPSSRPIRMAQAFAGSDQGMHFSLRPGTEVVLAFVDGDPDRPIIMGALPNATSPSPITARHANRNRIATGSGVLIEIADGT